jgi:hypothetical protein
MELGYHTNGRVSTTIALEGGNIAVVADDFENETLAPTYASSFPTTPVPSPVDASTEDVSVDAPTENAKNDATPAEVPVDTPAENPPPAEKSDGTVTCSLSIKISFSIILFVVALFS